MSVQQELVVMAIQEVDFDKSGDLDLREYYAVKKVVVKFFENFRDDGDESTMVSRSFRDFRF